MNCSKVFLHISGNHPCFSTFSTKRCLNIPTCNPCPARPLSTTHRLPVTFELVEHFLFKENWVCWRGIHSLFKENVFFSWKQSSFLTKRCLNIPTRHPCPARPLSTTHRLPVTPFHLLPAHSIKYGFLFNDKAFEKDGEVRPQLFFNFRRGHNYTTLSKSFSFWRYVISLLFPLEEPLS